MTAAQVTKGIKVQEYSIDIQFCEKNENAKPKDVVITVEADDAYSAYDIVYKANKDKYSARKYKYVWYRPRLSCEEKSVIKLKNAISAKGVK